MDLIEIFAIYGVVGIVICFLVETTGGFDEFDDDRADWKTQTVVIVGTIAFWPLFVLLVVLIIFGVRFNRRD